MAQVTPKLEILIDLSKPSEEITQCIAAIVNSHPGKELEILNKVDLWLGETISGLEKSRAESQSTQEKIKAK